MRFIFMFILMFILFFSSGFCLDYNDIDNIYGEYIISGTKNKISMDLKDVPLIDVLKALSKQSGLNFISTEAVSNRNITLYLDNVPLKDAMDIIFKANGLSYDYFPKAKIFVVKEMGKPRIELKTKVYNLKYTRLKDSRFQQEIDDLMSTGIGNVSGSDTTDEAEGIIDAVKGVLTENGKVTKDDYTNSLIVVDVPSQFPIIDKVIAQLDRPQPKVMIEVEMLDVSKKLIDQMGIDYENGITFTFTGGSYSTSFPFSKNFWRAHTAGSDQFKYEATPSTMNLNSLTAMLKFFSKDTSTRFLARPKILTLSNETAEVNLTTNAAVGVTITTTDNGTTTQEVERMNIGTKLRVTPNVNPLTKDITMVVEVYNRETNDSKLSISQVTEGKLQDPEERGTKSVVRLRDGETLLLGGLIRKKKGDTFEKVPFLGDLPMVGSLFRYKNKDSEERELLVFLTPHIVYDSGGVVSLSKLGHPREQSFYSRHKAISEALDTFSKR